MNATLTRNKRFGSFSMCPNMSRAAMWTIPPPSRLDADAAPSSIDPDPCMVNVCHLKGK